MAQEPSGPLTSGEVAKLFKVHPMTVARWADEGLLDSFRTPSGQRRFRWEDVQAFLAGDKGGTEPEAASA